MLKEDGSVVTWSIANWGGDSKSVASHLNAGVKEIYSTPGAFAALKEGGFVVTWGHGDLGGDSRSIDTHLRSGVKKIYSTDGAFAALKTDGSVVTWGKQSWGGNSSSVVAQIGSGVHDIYSSRYSFARLFHGPAQTTDQRSPCIKTSTHQQSYTILRRAIVLAQHILQKQDLFW